MGAGRGGTDDWGEQHDRGHQLRHERLERPGRRAVPKLGSAAGLTRACAAAVESADARIQELSRVIDALDSAEPEASAAVEREDFTAAMAALARLRGPIDAFFDHVTVNDPDPQVRERRLNLLLRFRDAVHKVADFSRRYFDLMLDYDAQLDDALSDQSYRRLHALFARSGAPHDTAITKRRYGNAITISVKREIKESIAPLK